MAGKKKKTSGKLGLFLIVLALAAFALALFFAIQSHQTPPSPSETSEPASDQVSTEPSTTKEPVTENVTSGVSSSEPQTEPVTTEEDPPVPQETVLKVALAGDVLIHECVFLDAKTGSTYDFSPMFEGIADLIGSSDIAFVNMECPIAGNSYGIQGYPTFNAPTEAGDDLVSLGFNVVNIANNHMLDFDKKTTGYKNSVAYWKSKDVLMIGGYENQEDYRTIRYLEIGNIRIAFLSFVYSFSKSVNAASPDMVVPFIDEDFMESQIQKAKNDCDLVFVSMHWGKEYETSPNSTQKKLARKLADAGADLIIGTHPHTVQPIEWISGKNGNRTLCVYSLGNLISSQLYMNTILECIVTLDIRISEESVSLENVIANPVVCHYETDKSAKDSQGFNRRQNIRVLLLKNYTEEMCAVHGAHLAYPDYKKETESFTVRSLGEFFSSVIGEEFLPGFLRP